MSTTRIAEQLNISQPALYKHFASKDAIWTEVSRILALRIETNIETRPGSLARRIDCVP